MINVDGKLKLLLIISLAVFIINLDYCDANKDKGKGKHKHDNQQHQRKNATTGHHKNTTSNHDASGNQSHPHNPPSDIGWSLHNDPNSPHSAPSPHGYAVHQSGHGHPDPSIQAHQSSAGAHQQHHAAPPAQHAGQQHDPPPPYAPPGQQPQAPQTGSGPSAVATGIGGVALGAIGGAAGGYFLSNALNSGGKSVEKSESETTNAVIESTLSTLAVGLAQDLSGSTEAVTTTEGLQLASDLSSETTPVAQDVTTEDPKSSQLASTAAVTVSEPSTVIVNSAGIFGSSQEKNHGGVFSLSSKIFAVSLLTSILLIVKY